MAMGDYWLSQQSAIPPRPLHAQQRKVRSGCERHLPRRSECLLDHLQLHTCSPRLRPQRRRPSYTFYTFPNNTCGGQGRRPTRTYCPIICPKRTNGTNGTLYQCEDMPGSCTFATYYCPFGSSNRRRAVVSRCSGARPAVFEHCGQHEYDLQLHGLRQQFILPQTAYLATPSPSPPVLVLVAARLPVIMAQSVTA
jgi:hypothetical protein